MVEGRSDEGGVWSGYPFHPINLTTYLCNQFFKMKTSIRRFIVFNRLFLAVALIALGLWLGFGKIGGGWWGALLPFLIAILMVVAHFLVGPMTLIQGYIEDGDMEGAQKLMDRIKYPNLLYKPIRSSYYMLRANFSTMGEDLDKAESDLRKGLEAGMPEKEYEGTAYLQLGAIAFKKGKTKEAYEHLRKAVKIGLPDKENEATAYLQLSGICMQRRDFRGAKLYFSKAKACKPKNEQVVAQINEMSKYMARIPG
jgi:tetratricopeptide (TPR) repeat protein